MKLFNTMQHPNQETIDNFYREIENEKSNSKNTNSSKSSK
jgi:hypothetical protein